MFNFWAKSSKLLDSWNVKHEKTKTMKVLFQVESSKCKIKSLYCVECKGCNFVTRIRKSTQQSWCVEVTRCAIDNYFKSKYHQMKLIKREASEKLVFNHPWLCTAELTAIQGNNNQTFVTSCLRTCEMGERASTTAIVSKYVYLSSWK